jgi:hypothetical protein
VQRQPDSKCPAGLFLMQKRKTPNKTDEKRPTKSTKNAQQNLRKMPNGYIIALEYTELEEKSHEVY